MTMSAVRRPIRLGRKSLVAVVAGAGVALTPIPAMASAPAPTAAQSQSYPPAPTAAAQKAVDTARAQLGKPYQYGGDGPDSYDCSGLTQYSWGAAGVSLPHSASGQSTMGTPVSRDQLQPGDLVFFYDGPGHVGIYVGNNQIIHAPTEGDVVKYTDIDAMGGYDWARRVG
jgi:cell wall-associated NlpC family hydrolase